MKKDIHPSNYREVVFQDITSGKTFLTKSTVSTRETIELEGTKYPLFRIETSSDSHPFYTGEKVIIDTAGRVERFNKRYNKA